MSNILEGDYLPPITVKWSGGHKQVKIDIHEGHQTLPQGTYTAVVGCGNVDSLKIVNCQVHDYEASWRNDVIATCLICGEILIRCR